MNIFVQSIFALLSRFGVFDQRFKAGCRLARVGEIAAAQFGDQKPLIVFEKAAEQTGKIDVSPTDRHVGITFTQWQLMGLLFFRVVNAAPEIVVDMAVTDQVGDGTNRLDLIETVKIGRHIQVAEIEGYANIRPIDPFHLLFQQVDPFSIAVGRMMLIGTGVLHADHLIGVLVCQAL
jgi:hypothetical protein